VNAYIIQQLQTGAIVIDSKQLLHTCNAAASLLLDMEPEGSDIALSKISPGLDQAVTRWHEQRRKNPQLEENNYIDEEQNYEATFSSSGSESNCGVLITLEDLRQVSDKEQQMKNRSISS
jgi:sensor histidine kinase regulating citrate/malate metabolism